MGRMLRALRQLWDTCFEPYWPRMRAVLEADVVYRGRQIAQSGLAAMLNGISSRVEYEHGVVSVRLADPAERTQRIDGDGLTLVPTMFTRRASAPVGDGPPMIMYTARGQGALWEAERIANPAAVAEYRPGTAVGVTCIPPDITMPGIGMLALARTVPASTSVVVPARRNSMVKVLRP